MIRYEVPPDVSEKEKVIGGVLNINQFLWILLGVAIGLGVFGLVYSFMGLYGLIIAVPCMLIGTPFALYKKQKLTLFKYLVYKRKFKKKTKKLVNKRKGGEIW